MRTIFFSILLGLWAGNAYGSYSSQEAGEVYLLKRGIETYHSTYGVLPTRWSELDEFMDRPLDEYFHFAPPSKRYTFVRGFQLPSPLRGEIVAVTRKPIYEVTLSHGIFGRETGLKGPGRYIIFQDHKGVFGSEWMPEDYINRAFAEASRSLPVPDNEPESKAVANARLRICVRRCIYAFLILSPIGWYWLITGGKRTTEQDGGGKPATCPESK